MVAPKNYLPPESQLWRRDIEARLKELETSASNLQTAYRSSDARLGSLVGSVKTLGDTVGALDSAVTTLNSTVVAVEDQARKIPIVTTISNGEVEYSISDNQVFCTTPITWPQDKTEVSTIVTLQGTFYGNGVAFANIPVWYIRINGWVSTMIRSIEYRMDEYYFSGSFSDTSLELNDFEVDVLATTGTGTPIPSTATNTMSLQVLTIASAPTIYHPI